MWIFPRIMASITQKPRYRPDIEWSKTSWTHNIFRFYEFIFWRRIGIRAESSSKYYFDEHNNKWITTHICHSWESVFAYFESYVRGTIPRKVPIRIWIPYIQTSFGFKFPASPYLFAIAFDATAINSSNSLTWNHTCTGSNGLLTVGGEATGAATDPTITASYNSASATSIVAGGTGAVIGGGWGYLFYLLGPSTGSNTITCTKGTGSGFVGLSTSYTGVKQSAQPDSSNTGTALASSLTVSTMAVASNTWGVFYTVNGASAPTAGSNTTNRQSESAGASALADTNAAQSSGSFSMTESVSSTHWGGIIASFAPVAAAATARPFRSLLGVGI